MSRFEDFLRETGMEMHATKEKILFTAIKLFSNGGYDKVSVRDLAENTGISVSSIYSHFRSKEEILKGIYAFFCEQRRRVTPTLENLLLQAENDPVKNVFERLHTICFPPEIADTMEHILNIAISRVCIDKESEQFVFEHFFTFAKSLYAPVLDRMIKCGKIDPVDIETLANVRTHFLLGVATLNNSGIKISMEHFNRCLAMIYSLFEHTADKHAAYRYKTDHGGKEERA